MSHSVLGLFLAILLGGCQSSQSLDSDTGARTGPRIVDESVNCPPNMIGIGDGTVIIGEWDPPTLAEFGPDRVLPRNIYSPFSYCIGAHPFPGRHGLPWPIDEPSVVDLPKIARKLRAFGRRLCDPLELSLAAAGLDNWRYPWDPTERGDLLCETDDERPTSLGSHPDCRSPAGLWDLQVRASWSQMTDEVRWVLPFGLDEDPAYLMDPYWVWGASVRPAPGVSPTNFGLHHHKPGKPALDRHGLRICADPGKTTGRQNAAWATMLQAYPDTVSFGVLINAKTP